MTLEEAKQLKKGQWIFTCHMEPKQFGSFYPEKNPKDYSRNLFTDEQWEFFSKYDDFETMDGSSHSVKNCSCRIISEEYAQWFIKNKCWKLFPDDKTSEQWQVYENRIKELCQRDGIVYEGF